MLQRVHDSIKTKIKKRKRKNEKTKQKRGIFQPTFQTGFCSVKSKITRHDSDAMP